MKSAKPYDISRKQVWAAYLRVKAKQGAAGIDEETIADFEKRLKDNLYKIWNRMSSGSYFPPAVKTVAIPKKDGGERKLGIPTVSDRIAQTVVKMQLEPTLEPLFHPDSYGYRPGKSALDAVEQTRQRCWRYDWVIDLDIKGFFDHINHELLMRAVKKHAKDRWVISYIERWLKAPVQNAEGHRETRSSGTPQGSVISPLLANLYLHYAFDDWMRRNYPHLKFERYADDAKVHCRTQLEAKMVRKALEKRMAECRLELHPHKTKIVYCKDDDRRGKAEHEKFDFLGYTFRARRSKNRYGKYFVNFSPAVSNDAAQAIRQSIRSWKLRSRADKTVEDLARMFNPMVRGWINYYGRFYKSALYPVLRQLDRSLVRWATGKYKKLRRHRRRATHWLGRIAYRDPRLWAHWQFGVRPADGRIRAV
jgi:RNA-directed DNA polymerase